MIASVDVSGLWELAYVVPVAVIVVATTYSLCVLGLTRASDRRREGDRTHASAYAVLGLLAGVAFAGEVVAGVAVIISG